MKRSSLFPLLVLGLMTILALGLLAVPLKLPLGALYWDLYFTIDGAYRTTLGQVPHVDFFVPSGALPYYLLAATQHMFPQSQPLLAAQYGILLITLPLMALVVVDAARRSQALALWLAIPFALLTLLPFNAISFYPAPGVDGVGLYNRQSGQVLYVLVAAMFAMADGWRRTTVLSLALAALFFLKINAFAPAAVLLVYGMVAGLVTPRSGLTTVGALIALVLLAGLPTGMLLPYLSDIGALASHNAGQLSGRLFTLLSVKFDVILPLAILACTLVLVDWRASMPYLRILFTGSIAARVAALRHVLTRDGVMLGVALVMAVVIENQNTGSQEFAFLWPLLLVILLRIAARPASDVRWRSAIMILFATATLPTAVNILHMAARTMAVAPGFVGLGRPELKGLDQVIMREQYRDHALAAQKHYPRARATYEEFAREGQKPSTILYSEIEYQTFYLLDQADAMGAIRVREQARGRAFDSVYTLGILDPMPYLLGKTPIKGVTISLDIGRGFPAARRERLVEAARAAEVLLLPRCPITPYILDVEAIFAPVLAERRREPLNPCWDLAVRP